MGKKKRRNRFQCVQKQPHMVAAREAAERVMSDAFLAIEATQCKEWVQEKGWRVRCYLTGGHAGPCVFRRTVAA